MHHIQSTVPCLGKDALQDSKRKFLVKLYGFIYLFSVSLFVTLRCRLAAGNLQDSLRGTGCSAWLEREPSNFPTSPLALMRRFVPVIKTIALANQDGAWGAAQLWDGMANVRCWGYK